MKFAPKLCIGDSVMWSMHFLIFTHLKLWIASARHNFKWVKIQIDAVMWKRLPSTEHALLQCLMSHYNCLKGDSPNVSSCVELKVNTPAWQHDAVCASKLMTVLHKEIPIVIN